MSVSSPFASSYWTISSPSLDVNTTMNPWRDEMPSPVQYDDRGRLQPYVETTEQRRARLAFLRKSSGSSTGKLSRRISVWIDDPDAIQSLALATGDPSNLMAQPSSLTMSGKIGAQLTTLNLKEELQLSLDTLCSRNTELFDLKLKLHTEKLEKAISHSARLVITSLSGPYERLEHEV